MVLYDRQLLNEKYANLVTEKDNLKTQTKIK